MARHALGLLAGVTVLLAGASAAARPNDDELSWRWPRAQPSEFAATVALGAGSVLGAVTLEPVETGWREEVFFDRAARQALRLDSRGARASAARTSDFIYYALMAQPVVEGLTVLPRSPDTWLNMTTLTGESLSLGGFVGVMTTRLVGRSRPFVDDCEEDEAYSEDCAKDATAKNTSFLSGHTLMAFTGAGLTCAHHQYLPIYGGNVLDATACSWAAAHALAVGLLRVMSDKHHASDVIVGATLGAVIGYGIPVWLHYGRAVREEPAPPAPKPAPVVPISFGGRF